VQLIESYWFTVSLSPECTLQALRDRVPGRYRHETDSTWSGGSIGSHHVVLVYANGQAGYGRDPYAAGAPTPVEPIAGQRCQLKPASYFEECLAALAANPRSSPSFGCCRALDARLPGVAGRVHSAARPELDAQVTEVAG
jgi:hypothetical protein